MKHHRIFVVVIMVLVGLFCSGLRRSRDSKVKIIQLPQPQLAGRLSFEEVLSRRRSVREFSKRPLDFTQLGQLAWAGQGITEKQKGLRTAPSAGATYPITLYFATQDGLFVYRPQDHTLEQLQGSDIREKLSAAASKQPAIVNAGCDIIVAGSVQKLRSKFGNKSRTYTLLEVGHVAQNIQLQAVGLELASVTIGGFDVRSVAKICKLPKDLEPFYVIPVGYPAERTATTSEDLKQNQTKSGAGMQKSQ